MTIRLMPRPSIRQSWDQSAAVAWLVVTATGPTRSDLPHGLRQTPEDFEEHPEWRLAFPVFSVLTKVTFAAKEVFKGSPPLEEWWAGGRLAARPGGFVSSVEKCRVPSLHDELFLFFRGDSVDAGKGLGEPLIWHPMLFQIQLLGERAAEIDPRSRPAEGPWYQTDVLLAELTELASDEKGAATRGGQS